MDISVDQSGRAEPHQQTADQVLSALDTDADVGLTSAEARSRLDRFGRNELTAEEPVPAWRKFVAQFADVLVILLLIAALVSAVLWLYERKSTLPYEAMAISAIVLLNGVMGYIQQARAEQAVAALQQISAAHANVVRDGAPQSIAAAEIVPGDIVLIEEGDTVPADARLLQTVACKRRRRRSPARACRCRRTARRSRERRDLAIGATWFSAVRRRPTGAGARLSPPRVCRPRWAVSPAC